MSDDSLTIRQATQADLPGLRQVFADVHRYHVLAVPDVFRDPEEPIPTLERFREMTEGDDRDLLVAEWSGEVVGLVTVQEVHAPSWPTHVPRAVLLIDVVGVRDSWRGRGIGKALMDAAHAWGVAHGLDEAELTVYAFNQPARGLYESIGYVTSRYRLVKRGLLAREDVEDRIAPRLTDGVVVLDGHTLADVPAHLAGEDEEQARRFGWYPLHSTEETVGRAIRGWQRDWWTGGPVRAFAARSPETGELMGGVEIRLQDNAIAHISYWVFPPFRGKGVATRAIRLAAGYAFDALGVERLEAYVEVDNIASRTAVLRAGFVEEGILRSQGVIGDARRDMVLHSRLPTDT